MVVMVESVIFTEGYDAWHQGIPREANPCRRSFAAWDVWLTGWDQAKADADAAANAQATNAKSAS